MVLLIQPFLAPQAYRLTYAPRHSRNNPLQNVKQFLCYFTIHERFT